MTERELLIITNGFNNITDSIFIGLFYLSFVLTDGWLRLVSGILMLVVVMAAVNRIKKVKNERNY